MDPEGIYGDVFFWDANLSLATPGVTPENYLLVLRAADNRHLKLLMQFARQSDQIPIAN